MEFIEGKKVKQLVSEGADLTPLAKKFLDAAFQMLYVDGFFHGDAHPGNIFIMPDGRIAFIDFGMVGRLSQEMRERVVDIVFALLREDLRGVARTFLELGTPEGRIDTAAFEAECVQLLEQEVVGRPLSEIEIGMLFMRICEGAVKYRIRMPADFTMMFKAMVTAEGFAKLIAPDINVIDEARPHIMRMVAERYSVKRLSQEALGDLRKIAQFARSLPVASNEILRQLQQGELHLSVKLDGLDEHTRMQMRAGSKNQLAIIFLACCVSGTIALSDTHALLGGWPLVSILLYTLAGLSGISLLRHHIRYR